MVAKSVEVQIDVSGDVESKAKLDALDAKAEELKKAFPTYALKIDSATATSKLAVFRTQLKSVADTANKAMDVQILTAKATAKLDDIRLRADKLKATFPQFTATIDDTAYKLKLAAMAADAKITGDIISRELSGGKGGGNLGGSAAGDAAGAAESGAGSIGPIPLPALLAIVPALGAALVEVTGLVSGFAAATAGAGSFALLAAPAVKKVETAYTSLNTAQLAYQAAQAKEQLDPTKANATALQNTAVNLKLAQDAISKLPASEQGAITGIQGLVTQFGKLSTAFQPEAFKVFNAGLKLAGDLLPAITPFARTFADVVTKLLTQAGKFTQTKGFTDFLAQFHGIEGPAITAIGDGIGKVAIAVGKLLTTMSGKDVATTIKIAFDVIAGAINTVSYVVKTLMTNWDSMSAVAKKATHDVAAVWDAFRHGTAVVFDGIRGDIAHYWDMTFSNTIGRVTKGLHDTAALFDTGRHTVAAVFAGIRTDIGNAWNLVWADTVTKVTNGITKVVGFFKNLPGQVVSVLSSLGTSLLNIGKTAMTDFLNGLQAIAATIISWGADWIKNKFLALWHDILKLGSPSAVMYDIGKYLMQGLANGIKDHAAQAVSHATAAANAVTGAMGSAGVSNASGVAALKSAAAKHGWTSAAEWAALNYVEMREAGYSLTARNPSSGAYGMAQFINGPSEYAQYGGNSTTYAGQATAMANYIAQRYGDPIAAAAHERAYNWYGSGLDAMFSRPTLIGVGERGPERVQVTPSRGGGSQDPLVAELRRQNGLLEQLIGVTAAVPAKTGQHVGAAIGGAAAQGSFRSRYPGSR